MKQHSIVIALAALVSCVGACTAADGDPADAPEESGALGDEDGDPGTDQQAFTATMGLPFPAGAAYTITQGPHGGFSHLPPYNQHAVDFAMPAGHKVVASYAGTVAYSGWFQDEIRVIIDHGHNACTLYTHLSSALPAPGQRVRRGQHIGNSGATGRVTQAHLHWGMIRCDNWQSRAVVRTAEMGTSYPVGAVARSRNVLH